MQTQIKIFVICAVYQPSSNHCARAAWFFFKKCRSVGKIPSDLIGRRFEPKTSRQGRRERNVGPGPAQILRISGFVELQNRPEKANFLRILM